MQVGHAEVVLSLQDAALKRELSAAERKVLATVKKIDSMRGEAEVGLEIAEVEEKAAVVRREVHKLERERANIEVGADTGAADAKLAAVLAEAEALDRKKIKLTVEVTRRRDLENQLSRMYDATGRVKSSVDEADTAVGRFFRNLSQMTLRLGPFSASLKQFGAALVTLGPIVSGLVGYLGALAGVLATGALGALTIGAAGVTGFAMAALGLMFVIKPLAKDFKSLSQASNAYNQAVLKYGKGSDQAKAKQKQLNQMLKGVSPVARQAFQDLGKMRTEWQKMTGPARTALMEVMGQGLKTVQTLMPQFANRTNQTAGIVSNAFGKMFQGLRSKEGRDVLDTIFKNFNSGLKLALPGLGQLGAAFGRVMAVASQFLPGTARSFLQWATGINSSAKNTDALEAKMHRLADAARSVGRFFTSAFRLIGATLGAGAGTGIGLLDSLTNAMNRATASVRAGGLDQFFKQSATMAREFWSALSPLLSSLGSFVSISTPFARIALQLLEPWNKLIAVLLKVPAIRGILQALAGTMATVFVAGKIWATVRALGAMVALVRGLGVAGVAGGLGKLALSLAGISAASTVVGSATAKGLTSLRNWGPAAEKSAASLGAVEGAAGGAAAGLGARLIPALARFAAPAALAVVPATALAIALNQLHKADAQLPLMGFKDLIQLHGKAAQESDHAAKAFRVLNATVADTGSQMQHARLGVDQARESLKATKRGTIEHRQALLDYRDAVRQSATAELQWKQTTDKMKEAADKQVTSLHFRTEAAIRMAQQDGISGDERRKITALEGQYQAAMNRSAAVTLNIARAQQGLITVSGRAEQSLGRLAMTAGGMNVAKKISLKFEAPKDVGNVSAAAQRALSAGIKPKQVLKVVADTKSAEAAIHRLDGMTMKVKTVRAQAQVGGAIAAIGRILGIKIPDKVARVSGNVGGAIAAIGRILGIHIPQKDFNVNARDHASGVIGGVLGLLSSLHDRSVTVTTTHVNRIVTDSGPGHHRAAGRGAGVRERALVGEGGGPEVVIDKRTGVVRKVAGPTIMDLGPDDYVIPTESAYRGRSKDLLRALAHDLGIPGFKKGRVPKRYRYGSVPEDSVQRQVSLWEGRVQSAKGKKGHPGLGRALGELHQWRRFFGAVHGANTRISRYDTLQDADRTAMENANKAGDIRGWRTAHKSRTDHLRSLEKWLARAYRFAPKGSLHRARLLQQLNTARGEILDERGGAFEPTSTQALTMEGYLKQAGLFGQFQQLGLGVAKASTTLSNTADDLAAHGAFANFWRGVIGRIGPGGPKDLLTEAYTNLGQELSAAQPGSAGTSDIGQAQLDKLQQQLKIAQNEAAINAAFAQVAGGPGDIGSGNFASARMAARGGPTINVYTLHPGDPRTLEAIGSAATAGMSYQGYQSSPRLSTGL